MTVAVLINTTARGEIRTQVLTPQSDALTTRSLLLRSGLKSWQMSSLIQAYRPEPKRRQIY